MSIPADAAMLGISSGSNSGREKPSGRLLLCIEAVSCGMDPLCIRAVSRVADLLSGTPNSPINTAWKMIKQDRTAVHPPTEAKMAVSTFKMGFDFFMSIFLCIPLCDHRICLCHIKVISD